MCVHGGVQYKGGMVVKVCAVMPGACAPQRRACAVVRELRMACAVGIACGRCSAVLAGVEEI